MIQTLVIIISNKWILIYNINIRQRVAMNSVK